VLLRPSNFPMWPDCQRRTAARMFGTEIADAGYHLREIATSVGASVGTATHTAVAHCLTEKMQGRGVPPDVDCTDKGIDELRKRIADEGVQWDATTPNLNTAQRQVQRQYKIYRLVVAERINPVAVEHRVTVNTIRGNKLSGQIDCADTGIRDLKTGTVARNNIAQYGGYSMLRRGEGHAVPTITEDYVPRVAIDKEQPPPLEIAHNPQLAEAVAARIIQDIESAYEQFRSTGDNLTFLANPASVLCSDRFCLAHGTDWCEEGRK